MNTHLKRTTVDNEKFPLINVLNVMRGFHQAGVPHHITPYRFVTRRGETHKIKEIRQVHKERTGKGFHHHYVVKTEQQKYFHIIFDTQTLTWRMVQEISEEFLFL